MKYFSILIIALLFISCRADKSTTENNKTERKIEENQITLSDEQLKSVPIKMVQLEKHTLAGSLQINGKVDLKPDYIVSLASALGGHIKSINVIIGQSVSKGQTILILEDNQFIQLQQDYLIVKAQLLSAAPNFQRQKELNSSKSASDKAMQQAETEYRSLLVNKKALEEKLRLIQINPDLLTTNNIKRSMPIIAPFNGIVNQVFVNRGKYVSPSDVLVEIINPVGIYLKLKVFEKDINQIHIGQSVLVYTNADPNHKIQAKITTRGTSVQDDGSIEFIAQFIGNNKPNLSAGMYINAQLELENMETFTLPEEAVLSFEGKNYVFEAINKNNFKFVKVEAGKAKNGQIPISEYQNLLNKKIVGAEAYTLLMALKNKAEN